MTDNAGWQAIASAPKDGTQVLVFDDTIYSAYYRRFGWFIGFDREDDPIYVEPTHWMPLPPPPDAD